jgi:hypothetical protein
MSLEHFKKVFVSVCVKRKRDCICEWMCVEREKVCVCVKIKKEHECVSA